MTTGQRIKTIRKEKGLTQKALGELCGIAEPTIRQYESGRLNPKFETIEKIATKGLDVLPETLMPGKKIQLPPEVAEVFTKLSAFCKYLEKSGYSIEAEKVGESETGEYIEHKENGVVIGKSWVPDEEYYNVTLSKDGKTAVFTHNEFCNMQSSTDDIIDVRFFKQIMEEGENNAKKD